MSRPSTQDIILSDLAIYEEYKKANSKYDLVETEVFYIATQLENQRIIDDINCHTRDFNRINQTQLIPNVFMYCNWNIPPFIMEEKQFTEHAKKKLVIDIKTFLHRTLL